MIAFDIFFSGYLVVAPSELRPGTEEVVSVTILKPSEPILVEAKLFAKTNELLTESGHEIFGELPALPLFLPRSIDKASGISLSLSSEYSCF